MTKARGGPSIGHVVLTVRDIEASHRFYTDVVGFEQCGQFDNEHFPDVDMRFYRGSPDSHHDLALVQSADPSANPPVAPYEMFGARAGLNHLAVEFPDRESFLARLEHLQANGIKPVIRGNHGMTHSAYIEDPDGHGIEIHYSVPSEYWEGDVSRALSHFEPVRDLLEDSTDYRRFSKADET